MRLAKEISTGKKFDLAPEAKPDILEPLDLDLLKALRKKHNL